jgi:hypothetical protein
VLSDDYVAPPASRSSTVSAIGAKRASFSRPPEHITIFWYLEQLGQYRRLLLIRVLAPEAVCLSRIAARDASVHIPVPAAVVRDMHEKTEALSLPWDFQLSNDGSRSAMELAQEIVDFFTADPAVDTLASPRD